MCIVLIFPPHWNPTSPPAGIASLSSSLKKNGIETYAYDLNIESINNYFNENYNESIGDYSFQKILRSDDFYDYNIYRKSLTELGLILKKSKENKNYNFTFCDTYFKNVSTYSLKDYINIDTPFDNYLKKRFELIVNGREPKIIGFSVNNFSQLIMSIKMVNYLPSNKKIHISIGGCLITKEYKYIPNDLWNELFEYFDSIIVYEGELPIVELYRSVMKKQSLSNVSNLITKQNRIPKISNFNLNDHPVPDYSGFPINDYYAPDPVITYPLTKGCYWKKCSFCNYNSVFSKQYDEENVDSALDKIKKLTDIYDFKYFNFGIASARPQYLKLLCSKILQKKMDINWAIAIRSEKGFNSDILKLMQMAGCRRVFTGFETGSERIMSYLKKGVSTIEMKKFVDNCYKYKLSVEAHFMYGLPVEEINDTKETINFLKSIWHGVSSCSFHRFQVNRGSEIYEKPSFFGIESISGIPKTIDSFFQQPIQFKAKMPMLPIEYLYDKLRQFAEEKRALIGQYVIYKNKTPNNINYNLLYTFKGKI